MNLIKHIYWRRISQREIRNSAAAEKSELESPPSPFGYGRASEGGQKFLPPNPLPFCPPERSDFCSAKGGAISQDFVQKRFELRSVIATNSDIFQIQRRLDCSLAPPEFIPHGDAGTGLASQKALPFCAFSATAGKYFGIKS